MVHSGTTMSRRGRVREQGMNSLNVIRGSASAWEVSHLVRTGPGTGFAPYATHSFVREGAGPTAEGESP